MMEPVAGWMPVGMFFFWIYGEVEIQGERRGKGCDGVQPLPDSKKVEVEKA